MKAVSGVSEARLPRKLAGNPPQNTIHTGKQYFMYMKENMQSCTVKTEKQYQVWFYYTIRNCSIIQETAPFIVGLYDRKEIYLTWK